jgi:hypothetical protein
MGSEGFTMAEQIPPYPKNALGDFYVENDCCIACEAPYHEAPDLMAHDEEVKYLHCYFKRQPETPEEVERAVKACVASCVRAVRYSGTDPTILKRFQELRREDSCDAFGPKPRMYRFLGGGSTPPTRNEPRRLTSRPAAGATESRFDASPDPMYDRELDG